MNNIMEFCVKNIITIIAFILGTINTNSTNLYEVVSNSILNIREQPNSNSKILGILRPKAQIHVTKFVSEWAEFNHNGQLAYVHSKFLNIVNISRFEEINLFKVISVPHLNVRSQPTTNSSILGTLQTGVQIEVISNSGAWSKIRFKKNIGYVNTKYIVKVEDLAYTLAEAEDSIIIISEPNAQITDNFIVETENAPNYKTNQSKTNIAFIPNIYCGYSNFTSSKVSPKCTIGGGIDFAFQFIAKDKIAFIPKDYFIEASLGYSSRGAAAFPLHYINLKLQPFGYRYNLSKFTLFGKLGVYTGYTFSSIETNHNSFDTNIDIGTTVSVGVEYGNIGIGILFERGFTNVCNSNLDLKNSCFFLNLSYRLFSLR